MHIALCALAKIGWPARMDLAVVKLWQYLPALLPKWQKQKNVKNVQERGCNRRRLTKNEHTNGYIISSTGLLVNLSTVVHIIWTASRSGRRSARATGL